MQATCGAGKGALHAQVRLMPSKQAGTGCLQGPLGCAAREVLGQHPRHSGPILKGKIPQTHPD